MNDETTGSIATPAAPRRRAGHDRPTVADRLLLGRVRAAIDAIAPDLAPDLLHKLSRHIYDGLRDLVPVGQAWADTLPESDRAHVARTPWQLQCPDCGDAVDMVGLDKLVYSFEVCACGDPDYPHLIERLWHRDCFAAAHRDDVFEEATEILQRLLAHPESHFEFDRGSLYVEGAVALTDTETKVVADLLLARSAADAAPAPAADTSAASS